MRVSYKRAQEVIAEHTSGIKPATEQHAVLLGAEALRDFGTDDYHVYATLEANHHFLMLKRTKDNSERLVPGNPRLARTVRILSEETSDGTQIFARLLTRIPSDLGPMPKRGDIQRHLQPHQDDPLYGAENPYPVTTIGDKRYVVHVEHPVVEIDNPEDVLGLYGPGEIYQQGKYDRVWQGEVTGVH